MSLIFVRVDSEISPKNGKLQIFEEKIKQIVLDINDVKFVPLKNHNFQELSDHLGIQNIDQERDTDLENSIFDCFNNSIKTLNWKIIIAFHSEIEKIVNYIRPDIEFPKFYDYTVISYNNAWFAEPVSLPVLGLDNIGKDFKYEQYNRNLTIKENVSSLIRSKMYPEIINQEISKAESHKTYELLLSKNLKNIVKSLRTLDLIDKAPQENYAENEINLKDTFKSIKKVNKEVKKFTAKAKRIITNLNYKKCEPDLDPSIVIMFAPKFSQDQIYISEKQSTDHIHHIITVENRTSYHWENLSIYIKEKRSNIYSIEAMGPNEKIEFKIEYDYWLLNDIGVFSFEVYYCNHVISNQCFIERILIERLVPKGNIHELHMRNNFASISDCIICYQRQLDNDVKTIAYNFKNFEKAKVVIIGLNNGENYNFQVWKNNEQSISVPITIKVE